MAKKQTPHRVDTTAGGFDAYLAVERDHAGYKLTWINCNDRGGAITASTYTRYRTEAAAKVDARRKFDRDPVRYTSYAKRPKNVCLIGSLAGTRRRVTKKRRK